MKPRVMGLDTGFGGLELTTLLLWEFGDDIDLTLVDGSDFDIGGETMTEVCTMAPLMQAGVPG